MADVVPETPCAVWYWRHGRWDHAAVPGRSGARHAHWLAAQIHDGFGYPTRVRPDDAGPPAGPPPAAERGFA